MFARAAMHHLSEDIPAVVSSHSFSAHKKTGFPIEGSDREAGCGRTQDSVVGEEVESLKRDSCSFPTPMAYERSQHHRSPPPSPTHTHTNTHPRPAERALATHVEVTEGKYTQERGHCLGFTPRAFRAGGLCWCFGFWPGGGVRIEIKAGKKPLSGQLTHVADLMTKDVKQWWLGRTPTLVYLNR